MTAEMRSSSTPPPRHPRHKRTYSGLTEYLVDVAFLLRNMPTAAGLMVRRRVSRAFRERLMLSVISVYGCRYCNWFHTGEALRAGVNQEEITRLLEGSVDHCPDDEAVALLYAQHWADSNCRPNPEAVERLEQVYGPDMARDIHVVLRMIRMGNLTGNTWDRLVSRLSFGRLGG